MAEENASQSILLSQFLLVTSQLFMQNMYTLAGCLYTIAY